MKPWEETWKVEAAQNGVEGRALLVDGEMVALFSGPDDAVSQPRAKFAAQAPAMARLLLTLRGLESECPGCSRHRMIDNGDLHTTDCTIAAVLKAAGVPT